MVVVAVATNVVVPVVMLVAVVVLVAARGHRRARRGHRRARALRARVADFLLAVLVAIVVLDMPALVALVTKNDSDLRSV